jgi:hypothetical protein
LGGYEEEYMLGLPLPVQLRVLPGPLEWVGFEIENQGNTQSGKFA